LGGEERAKDASPHIGGHALAGIDQAKHNAALVRAGGGLNGELAAIGHRLLGIEDDVQERLFEQLSVEANGREIRREIALDIDMALPGRGGKEVNQLFDHFAQGAGLGVEILHAGKAKKIVGNIDQVVAFGLQSLNPLQGPALALRLRRLQVFRKKLEI